MKQTSTEWLKTQIGNFPSAENLATNIDKLLSEAIERNKEEIKDAYISGFYTSKCRLTTNADEYFNKVYSESAASKIPDIDLNYKPLEFKKIDTPKVVNADFKFTSSQIRKMQLGHTAKTMEDKWNIVSNLDGRTMTLHFIRSWTGYEIFRLELSRPKPNEANFYASSFIAERNAEISSNDCDADDIEILRELIESRLLNKKK